MLEENLSDAHSAAWEAWIDVGGTFTDCYVREPGGLISRIKTLSSGKVLATVAQSTVNQFLAPELISDADDFWVGALVHCFANSQTLIGTAQVTAFSKGWLTLNLPIADLGATNRLELDPLIEAPVLAVHRLLQRPLADALPRLRVRLGTTKGTNALLTRRGARTALAITAPFEDLLTIGDQTRPKLFDLAIQKPPPLAELTIGIKERLSSDGSVLQSLDESQARAALGAALAHGCTSLAICLMHSYVNSAHELRLVELAREVGFQQISCSCQLAPLIEIVARAQTTAVDAYLSPIVRDYLSKLVAQFGGEHAVQLHAMTSGGGLVDWKDYFGKDSILSGPAGGVCGLRGIAKASNRDALIGLDMGGTSTDVCRVSSDHDLQYESTKAGVRILTPTLPIETIASGGGSICWFDGVSLRVGPQSAGAAPGPACYGQGGPLTVTDLNVFLGRIPEGQFQFPMDREAIIHRLNEMLDASRSALGLSTIQELANGLRRIANEQMAEAVRTVSIAQGVDPREHALVGFGGAAGQHICEVAELLGIEHVIDSPEAGLLSALGMGMADRRLDSVIAVYRQVGRVDWSELYGAATKAEQLLSESLLRQGEVASNLRMARWLELRYAKSDATLTIAWEDGVEDAQQLKLRFSAAHRQRYGYERPPSTDVELVAIRIEVSATSQPELPRIHTDNVRIAESPNIHSAWRVWRRSELSPGSQLKGPGIVLNDGSTVVLESGWLATCQPNGLLHLEHTDAPTKASTTSTLADATLTNCGNFDPIFRDCFAQRLSAIATQMGAVLQNTAVSVNVKQRRDYSCAIFDASGQLLANAPHVPVHLGAMGKTVEAVIAEFPDIREGDSLITNDPYRGGSHLLDVTVITPVFRHRDQSPDKTRPVFYVANRAHHADIGGIAPGSMSVIAKRLGEEGVVIAPMRVVAAGVDQTDNLRQALSNAEFPPRNIDENIADICAQLAANARGVSLLTTYADSTSWDQLERTSGYLLDVAESRLGNYLRTNRIRHCEFEDFLDDGTAIRVEISELEPGRIRIDFTGSGPTSPLNLNANPSIVRSAVIYSLRCLVADDLPLNDGLMRCVELIVPEGILNPPCHSDPAMSPAVAAGNVETSQRIVDVLLGALGAAAASQGTMNNLLFGNQRFGFYETICGGSGATQGHDGASGVHTHMTNTRLTDPEVLERRYPVRLIEFRVNRGSGGAGQWRGGDGILRVIEFLEDVELSLLTSRRGAYKPFGLDGGMPGEVGSNVLIRGNGSRQELSSCCYLQVSRGERIEIKTPGGGGFGQAAS